MGCEGSGPKLGGEGKAWASELVDLRALSWNRLVPFLHGLKKLQVAAA